MGKEDIKFILANPDWALSSSITPIYTWYKLTYMPAKVREHLERRREEWIDRGKFIQRKERSGKRKKAKPVISIQDRMKDQIADLCAEFEYFIDLLIDGEKTVKQFDPYKMMIGYQLKLKGPRNHQRRFRTTVC